MPSLKIAEPVIERGTLPCAPPMPPLIHLVSKLSTIELVVIGLIFWFGLALFHMHRNRHR